MKPYVVRFQRDQLSALQIWSGLQPTKHLVTAIDFKDADPKDEMHRLFNGENHIGAGLILKMTERGPIFNRNTIISPVKLDGMLLQQDPISSQMPKIPLGIPAQHILEIGHLLFIVTVSYTD